MGDSGSALIKILGISSVVIILALVGGAVFAEISDGPQCSSGVRGNLIVEPDLSEITAKSPVEALEETIAEDGTGLVGLHDVAGSSSELAAGFESVAANQADIAEGTHVFEFTDDGGNVISRVQVAAIGDGRYYVASAESCGSTK
jgi:hypothetical protein